MKVTLAKAVRLPGHPLRPAGYVLDVDQEQADELRAGGLVVDDAVPAKSEPAVESEAVEPEPAGDGVEPVKPRRAAKLEDWQEYVRALGFDPGKKTKQELQAEFG